VTGASAALRPGSVPAGVRGDRFFLPRRGAAGEIPCYAWAPSVAPRAVVVVVHGFGDHGRALPYQRLAGALVEQGFLVVSYDQRGHGALAGTPRREVRLDRLVEDLVVVTEQVRCLAEATPLVVVGLSMGAVVSVIAGRTGAARFDGVVAASAPAGPVRAGRFAEWLARRLGNLLPGVAVPTGIELSAVTDDAVGLAAYVGDPLFQTRIGLGLASDLLAAAGGLGHAAAELAAPALFLHGVQDRLAPGAAEALAGLRGPRLALETFPAGHHNLFLDRGRDEVFAAIARWIDALGRRLGG
jgi:alpha-beta hydrolase superfamily lysophospholipase